MKQTSFRSIVAMMVIFFAVTATSCKKENEILPENTPTVPATPPVVAIPPVSFQPTSIETKENGNIIRKQIYQYDNQRKLVKYASTGSISDSVLVRDNNIVFKAPGSNNINQSMTFNTDKTFKTLFSASSQIDFVNNQAKLSRMVSPRLNNAPLALGEFAYTNNNLSVIGAEISIAINYYNDLPYQKGINEIPVGLKPIRYYKIMEQENATSTVLYNKLIKQVILDFGNKRELHDYVYTFDANNRVTKISDTFTIATNTFSTQKILVSTITY